MTDPTLFDDPDGHDPIRPGTDTPTPDALVASLTPADRRRRLAALEEQSVALYEDGLRLHLGKRTVKAVVGLFSGGNDSTTLLHLFGPRLGLLTHAAHADTTIGIEQTRQFVRDTCASWGLPLIERRAPIPYRDLVLERGFPGPAHHFKMYGRLKERALDAVRHDLGVANSRKEAAVFVAGRRRAESKRREDVPLSQRDGSVVWVSPLAFWLKIDLNTYREVHGDVPRNEVSDLLHMSGECLCGAFAKPGELTMIGEWFPEVRAQIEALEAEVRAAGIPEPFCRWGHGQGGKPKPDAKVGALCTSCVLEGQTTLEDFLEVQP